MAIAVRDRLREKVAPMLAPGEQIQAVFSAQTFNGWWGVLSYWILIFKSAYRAVIVTDQRIAIFDTGRFTLTNVKSHLRDVPRSTQIGPVSGMWAKTETLGGRLYVHKRFHKDIEQADALRPAG